jgi:hypothetical protein
MALNFPGNPVDGQIYEGFAWNESIGVWQLRGLFALDSLQDVNAELPQTGDLLYYDGTEWVNVAPSDINIGASDENLSALFWMYA